jgi:hypothetical protein
MVAYGSGSTKYFPYFQQAFHVEDFLKDILFKSLTIKSLHGRHIFSTWEKAEKMLHQQK